MSLAVHSFAIVFLANLVACFTFRKLEIHPTFIVTKNNYYAIILIYCKQPRKHFLFVCFYFSSLGQWRFSYV